MSFAIEKVVKGVATGIGLASESYHHHKDKKNAQKATRTDYNHSDTSSSIQGPSSAKRHADKASTSTIEEGHEAAWELDEAQGELIEKIHSEETVPEGKGIENPLNVAAKFVEKYPPPLQSSADDEVQVKNLPLPVVLPQRRPESRTRGFICAYSPLLENCNIDQTMFLEFMHDLNVVCLPNPWIQAINLACFATQALPTVTGIIVSRIINKATEAASEAHSRSK